MIRRIAYFLPLLVVAAALWILNLKYPNYYLERSAVMFFACAVVYLSFQVVLQSLVTGVIKEPRTRYSLHRAISILFYAAALLAIIGTWIPSTQTLVVTYGLIAAGVAVTLQDVFRSLPEAFCCSLRAFTEWATG